MGLPEGTGSPFYHMGIYIFEDEDIAVQQKNFKISERHAPLKTPILVGGSLRVFPKSIILFLRKKVPFSAIER